MNCKKCGMPLEDGVMFCEHCGAPVEPEADAVVVPEAEEAVHTPDPVPAAEPAAEEASAPEAPEAQPIVLNTAAQAPQKRSPVKPILIGVGVVLLALIVVVALNFSSITNWFLLNFGSAEEIFQQVEAQNIETAADVVSAAYGAYLSNYEAQLSHMTGDVHIKLGDTILASANASLAAGGVSMDMDWLGDILLRMDVNYRDEGYRVNMGLGFGEQVVLSMDVLTQLSTGQVWVALPELSEQYVTASSDATLMPSMSASPKEVLQVMPAPESVNRLLDRYLKILISHFSDVTQSTETVTVDDLDREVMVLTARMNETAALNMAIEILETAREDQDLKAFFDDYGAYANDLAAQYAEIYGDAFENVDFYEQFQTSVDTELENVREQLADAGTDKTLSWIVYLDPETGGVVGRRLMDPDGEMVLDYLLLTEDDDVELYLAIDDIETILTGEYETNGFDGTLTVTVADGMVLEAEMTEMTQTTGTMKLRFGEAWIDAMGMDASMTVMTFEVTARGKTAGDVKVLMGGLEFVTVTFDMQAAEAEEITFPEEALDMNSNVDSYTWLMGMDFDAVLDNLKKAGLPDLLIQAVEQALAQALGDTSVQ